MHNPDNDTSTPRDRPVAHETPAKRMLAAVLLFIAIVFLGQTLFGSEPIAEAGIETVAELSGPAAEYRRDVQEDDEAAKQEAIFREAVELHQQGEFEKALQMMQLIAPLDEPGNAQAHLYVARGLLQAPPGGMAQQRQVMREALVHVNHCLTLDGANMDARLIRAQLLIQEERLKEAKDDYMALFESHPRFYKQIIELNNRLGMEDRNGSVLQIAELKLLKNIQQSSIEYGVEWQQGWASLVELHHFNEDFEKCAERLAYEIDEHVSLKEEIGDDSKMVGARLAMLKGASALTYSLWAESLGIAGEIDLETETRQLELLEMSLAADAENEKAKLLITRIATGDSSLADRAKAIYDVSDDINGAPSSVLNELGSKALNNENFEEAVRLFEIARKKSPTNPMLLNNLAWTYLNTGDPNPDRSLSLIDDAIRQLGASAYSRDQKVSLQSHFFDTRGSALMQLGRFAEALAAYEQALQGRPGNEKILESIVKCREEMGLDVEQAELLKEELEKQNDK